MIQAPQVKISGSNETMNTNVEPFSFSALHFLRAYNRLLSPSGMLLLYQVVFIHLKKKN